MEKVSGLQLHWYLQYWINSTKRIDYGISSVVGIGESTRVTLERLGEFPMPIDLVVNYADGSREMYYIPMNELLGKKPIEDHSFPRIDLPIWHWVEPTYRLTIKKPSSQISSLEIDPTKRMADINRKNNKIVLLP
jgi:hypothetical protein